MIFCRWQPSWQWQFFYLEGFFGLIPHEVSEPTVQIGLCTLSIKIVDCQQVFQFPNLKLATVIVVDDSAPRHLECVPIRRELLKWNWMLKRNPWKKNGKKWNMTKYCNRCNLDSLHRILCILCKKILFDWKIQKMYASCDTIQTGFLLDSIEGGIAVMWHST